VLKRVLLEGRRHGVHGLHRTGAGVLPLQDGRRRQRDDDPHDNGGYFDLAPKDLASDVRKEIIFTLEEMGFEIEASHHEVAEGQHEINFKYDDALTAADNIATFRAVVRAVASQHDLHATFMPKPIADINGSGMHSHISLFDEDGNAFADDSDEFNLSETAYQFMGGILNHAKAFTAVTNPTVNSYKRLVPGYEAPIYVAWSDTNRSALVRVPDAAGVSARFEVRSPDPSCNPYLGLASMIAAGLHGIETEADPGDPVREDIYEFDDEKRQEYGIETLPPNLGAAVEELETDEVLQDALGPHTSEKFAEAKSQEFSEYLTQVSQWEEDRYLESSKATARSRFSRPISLFHSSLRHRRRDLRRLCEPERAIAGVDKTELSRGRL